MRHIHSLAWLLTALLPFSQAGDPVGTCGACRTVLGSFKNTAEQGDQALITELTGLCKALHAADDDVCDGVMQREGPILAYDLRNMVIPSNTSDVFCINLFGVCDWPAVDTINAPVLPPKPANLVRPSPSKKKPLKVPHFSDIHVDLNYTVGASYNCTKNICCRPYTGAQAVGNNSYPAGPYGNNHCDAPASLEDSMYKAIRKLVKHRAFSIFTGDVVEGAVWLVTETEVENDLNNAYKKMYSVGETYSAIGNHDSSPVNSFPTSNLNISSEWDWVYDTLSTDMGKKAGSNSTKQILDQSGSYSVLVKGHKKLRMISLNTNFWYNQNFWLYQNPMQPDPAGLLAWLVEELTWAEAAHERVWIIGHIPPGSTSMFYDQSYYFDTIVQRFEASTLR